MMKFIDDFLNQITMYRLVLYVLVGLILLASVFSFFEVLPFSPFAILFSALFLILVCWVTNRIFAKAFKVPTNLESVYITALILTLIITPAADFDDLVFLALVGVFAMSSKYILAINKKHIFNPAALSVALTALVINRSASWWVGSAWMMPVVLLGGLLILRKIRRFNMIAVFFLTSLVFILGFSILRENNILLVTQKILFDTPILFFALVMLTEPLTTPPTKKLQVLYGALVGFLFTLDIQIGPIYLTPEVALLLGNIFSYIVSPKEKLILNLKEKSQIAPGTYDFVFGLKKKLAYIPGQYMEWTLSHQNPDSRGNRRYFTLASSPSEGTLRIGIKFYPNSSSFKKILVALKDGDRIIAGQRSGEFTLPKDPSKKLCFIAGGIGITPYRSIIKYLLDTGQKRDIILLYSNKAASDIVYKDIFDQANKQLAVKIIYVLTDKDGYINEQMIRNKVPDYQDRIFYISGPHSMVDTFEKILKEMGIKKAQIKIDFFPGYA